MKKIKADNGFSLIEVVVAMGILTLFIMFVGVCLANADYLASKHDDTSNSQMSAYTRAEKELSSTGSLSASGDKKLIMQADSQFTGFQGEISCEEKTYGDNNVNYSIYKAVNE